jgi:hypothetical protein
MSHAPVSPSSSPPPMTPQRQVMNRSYLTNPSVEAPPDMNMEDPSTPSLEDIGISEETLLYLSKLGEYSFMFMFAELIEILFR